MKGYFRKRGNKWSFTVDIGRDPQTGKRKQKTVSGFKTKKEAEAACAELIAQIEAGEYKEPSRLTLKEFILEFMEGEKHRVRESTWHRQMHLINKHIIPSLGGIPLKDFSPLHLRQFYSDKTEEGLSSTYLHSMHTVLSKIMHAAEQWGMVGKNPASLVPPPRPRRLEMSVWTIEEAQKFLKASEGRKYYIAYLLALYTGMRRGEILALQWSDIIFDDGIIRVQRTLYATGGKITFQQPKTKGAARTIIVSPFVLSALKKHRVRQQEKKLQLGKAYEDHNLVVSNWKGTPVYPTDIDHDFQAAIKSAGVPRIRFHDLRHTHATILLQLGEHPKVVSERLGHSTTSITMDVYSHVLPNMQKSLADNFEQAMKTRPPKSTLAD